MASREHADERDELARYLAALERDACYRVVRPLSPEGEAPAGPNAQPAATELVMFEGANGGELGPFVRKRLARAEGVGAAYETLFELQRAGMRFVHLPRIIDCYKTEDALVVVSEYVEGATLAALVRADGGGTAFARAVFPEVCDAVSELHGLIDPPLIHRDVKPTNIIISNRPDGVSATLIDFGIARRYRAGEGADTVRFGTRAYAPPEQFGFGQTSVRSDVYALGMVLLFCLTGTEPEGLPAADALAARGVEPALAEVVLKAAAFDPAARYASADALKRAFLAATDASRDVEPAPRVQVTPAATSAAPAPAAAPTPATPPAPTVPGATVDLPPAPVPPRDARARAAASPARSLAHLAAKRRAGTHCHRLLLAGLHLDGRARWIARPRAVLVQLLHHLARDVPDHLGRALPHARPPAVRALRSRARAKNPQAGRESHRDLPGNRGARDRRREFVLPA